MGPSRNALGEPGGLRKTQSGELRQELENTNAGHSRRVGFSRR